MNLRILIADDEKAARFGMTKALTAENIEIHQATTGREALHQIRRQSPHLVFLDLNMPEMDGQTVLRQIGRLPPQTEIVIVTADDTLQSAIECMKLGAADYVTKPFELEELRAIARRNYRRVALEHHVDTLQAKLDQTTAFGRLIGLSAPMQTLFSQLPRAAKAPLDILLQGETGTGKELIARQLHELSPRSEGRFVAVNTAAITESLAESELFGHQKGAFTGAQSAHTGVFEQANGGTLFLDEIGDMPLPLQSKILRVLQERTVLPVGGTKGIPIDIRVISATHTDLAQAVADGGFRQDLYYRIKGIPLAIPPLRDRHEDIILLANHFLDQIVSQTKIPRPTLSNRSINHLLTHAWPGNVRELENTIKAAASMAEGKTIEPKNFCLTLAPNDNETGWNFDFAGTAQLPLTEGKHRLVEWFETKSIKTALDQNGNNISAAARQLGLHRQSLQKKMAQLGIER